MAGHLRSTELNAEPRIQMRDTSILVVLIRDILPTTLDPISRLAPLGSVSPVWMRCLDCDLSPEIEMAQIPSLNHLLNHRF